VQLVHDFLQVNSEVANVSFPPGGQCEPTEKISKMRVFPYVPAAGTKRRHLPFRAWAVQIATLPGDKCPSAACHSACLSLPLQMQFIMRSRTDLN
jgi:hypothetical protein